MKRLLIGLMLLLLLSINAQAQDDEIVISLTVSAFQEDVFKDEVIAQFEAENPGVRVHIVNPPGFGVPFSGNETVEDYLDAVEDYVTSADVVLVDSDSLLPEATRAGYFLDMNPLIATDPLINSSDFHVPVWQSFQWDGGMWAVPVTMDASMIFYDREAFDAANLAYPSETWTMTDYEYVVRSLTQFDADGNTIMPGWINSGGDFGVLFLAAINDTVYDATTFPNMPRYDNAALEDALTILAQMYNDGLMDIPTGDDFDEQDVPLQLGRAAFNIGNFVIGGSSPKDVALLPGGRAGLVLDAYSISSGTQYPEAAYALVRYLSYSPQVADAFFAAEPARLSVESLQPEPPAFAQAFIGGPSRDAREQVERGLQNGISTGEARFSRYLEDAVTKMVFDGVDVQTALQEVELDVIERLQVADSRRDNVNIVVEQPPPPVELAPGEIRIEFGVTSFITPLPNAEKWDEIVAEFVFADAEVGDIVLDSTIPSSIEELTEAYDCFYMDANAVPSADLSLLRSIDPLLDSDPTFNRNDVIGLSQVQRNNQTWAMPLMIQPAAMRFNPDLFAMAGAWPPDSDFGWTTDQFEDAMRVLDGYLPAKDEPYEPREFGNNYLLMLIAAYGGLPFDYRTTPVTVDFTSSANVEAIRNVLDLAKDGYIDYRPLASVAGFNVNFGEDVDTALYSEVLNIFSIAGAAAFGGEQTDPDAYRNTLVMFPNGSQYTAVSYDVGAAYISANSLHTEACYRFISRLAQVPDLFSVMPARRSHINSFEVENAQGSGNVAFYNALDVMLQQPNTVNIPAFQFNMDGIAKVIESFWLNRAFDRYVLQDANLETELEDAELFTKAFIDCRANIPPFDPRVDEPQAYFGQFAQCAFLIDPTVMSFFSQ